MDSSWYWSSTMGTTQVLMEDQLRRKTGAASLARGSRQIPSDDEDLANHLWLADAYVWQRERHPRGEAKPSWWAQQVRAGRDAISDLALQAFGRVRCLTGGWSWRLRQALTSWMLPSRRLGDRQPC
jgi:hypothetical protein